MLRVTLRGLDGIDGVDGGAETHEIELTEDEWLMDACDATAAPLLFSCRSGECGICALHVERGAGSVDPPTARELGTIALRLPRADPRTRLGCRIRLRAEGAVEPVELVMLRG